MTRLPRPTINALLFVLLLFSSVDSTVSIQHRRKSKIDRAVNSANRALEHLASCCQNKKCRNRQSSDLWSGLYNFAALSKETSPKTYYRTIEIAKECRLQSLLRRQLKRVRKSCRRAGPCFQKLIITEFQAKRWNILLPGNQLRSPPLNVSLEEYLTDSNNWSPTNPFQIVTVTANNNNKYHLSKPSASVLDHALVIGWAALRSGNPMQGWSSMDELFKHINRLRPHYKRHLTNLDGIPKTRHHERNVKDDEKKETHFHVGEYNSNGSIALSAVRDLVWMAMHVIYRVAEFGLW
jgi:hypothetical protein